MDRKPKQREAAEETRQDRRPGTGIDEEAEIDNSAPLDADDDTGTDDDEDLPEVDEETDR